MSETLEKYSPDLDRLRTCLSLIEANDTNYTVRYGLVFDAVHYALQAGLDAGIRIDLESPEWPVAFIELPEGQVSWHLPRHKEPFDGHSTEEKYRRCREFSKSLDKYFKTGEAEGTDDGTNTE